MSGAAEPEPVNLAHLLTTAAARDPAAVAAISDGRRLTYAQLEHLRRAYAGGLAAAGVGPGVRVALLLPNGPEAIACHYAVLALGATAVPLNPLLRDGEVATRLAHAAPVCVVADPARAAELAAFAPVVTPERLAAGAPRDHVAAVGPGGVGVVLYTSGSTGGAKGVELTHAGVRAAGLALGDALGVTGSDVVLGAAPLAHVFGLCSILTMTIAAGAAVAFVPRFEPEAVRALIGEQGVTVFLGVPTMCIDLLALPGPAPAGLRVAHIGASPLAADVLGEFERRFGCVVLEGYGLTEASGVVATNRLGHPPRPGSVGPPAGATAIRIAADPPGSDTGEVLIFGPSLMAGYLDNPQATRAAFTADGWLRTGDVGRLDGDGHLQLIGRTKDVILRGGYTVYPSEVEDVLHEHPGVREAAVVGVPDPRLGEEVAALVVPAGDGCDPDGIREFARTRLAGYKYPRLIVEVDGLPRGATGKVERHRIDRAALAEAYAALRPNRRT